MNEAAPSIRVIGDQPAIALAARELRRCLGRMTGKLPTVDPARAFDPQQDALWVGLADAFPRETLPKPNDPRLDDGIFIDTTGARGILCGPNPRSVLLAAYRYLGELGCRWVRPGMDGEFLPRIDLAGRVVRVRETPSYRHRGVCIEGAVSLQHVADMIEWLPRVGMNSYFIQFREGFTFFDRWYSHMGNPIAEPEEFTLERARDLVRQAARLIRERDLIFHAVGHGWTCEPLGIPGLGWDYPAPPIPATAYPFLALVNGKRDLWEGIPLNTNLCYSNPTVRSMIVEDIVRYAQTHPEVDVLHVWLADGSNNQCECDSCRGSRPSDFYVRILNELDERLTGKGIQTRIVFLIYFDLLWPPETERLVHPDRFVLMFAPITRTYSSAFATSGPLPPLAPFQRNRLSFPKNVAENVAYLKAWQTRYRGDGFDFDYHLMWDHYADPGYTSVARVLHEDIQRLGELGLNGLMSCQVQRVFAPTGLPMNVMGWTLWDKSRNLDTMAADYYQAAFGKDGERCRAYLEELTRLFDPPYLRGEKPRQDSQSADALESIPRVLQAFRPVIQANLERADLDPCRAASWRILERHSQLVELLSKALAARARGSAEEAARHVESLSALAWRLEPELHPWLDTYLYTRVLSSRLDVKAPGT